VVSMICVSAVSVVSAIKRGQCSPCGKVSRIEAHSV
jgi:hypothetical protein